MQFCCSGCGAPGGMACCSSLCSLHMDPYPLKSISSQSLCTVHRYVLTINVPLISIMRDIVNFAAGNLHNCVFPFRQSRGPLKISQEMPVVDISRGPRLFDL
jgi:hypothetical protein